MTGTSTEHAPIVRFFAQLISYVLHPLFIPGAIAAWMLLVHPLNVLLVAESIRMRLLFMVVLNTVFFPGLVVLLLWRLGFTSGVKLQSQRERIIPLIICLIFYFWAWHVSRNLEAVPPHLVQWLLGVFIGSCAAMFTNNFFKISLHTIAIGGLLVFSFIMLIADPYWPHWMLHLFILLAGLSGSARLILNAHDPGEVYGGFLAGAICQLAAWWIVS